MSDKPLNIVNVIVNGFRRKLPTDEQAVVDAILEVATENKGWVALLAVINVTAAFLEANALGFITIGLSIGMGVTFDDQLQSLGSGGEYLAQLLGNYSSDTLLFIMFGLAVIVQLLRSTIYFVGLYGTILLQTSVEANTQIQLFRKYMLMPYTEISKYSVGDLYATMTFTSNLGRVFQTLNYGIGIVVTILFYGILLIILSWQLAIGGLLLFLCLAGIARLINRRIQIQYQEYYAARIEMSENNIEFLSSIYLVHTLNREKFAIDYTSKIVEKARQAQEKGLFWTTITRPIAEVFSIVAMVGFASVGYALAQSTGTTALFLPRLVAFIIILFRLLQYGQSFYASLSTVYQSWPSIKKVGDMLALDSTLIDHSGQDFFDLNTEIVFQNVSFKYDGAKEYALQDVSFTIPAGKKTAIVGQSGSGKSSLVHLLLRMYEPESGTIMVNGINLTDINVKHWRDSIALMNQSVYLYKMAVKENIRFGKLDAPDNSVIQASKSALAHDFIMETTSQYDTRVGYAGGGLSGGEQQRLALARAFVRDAEILIFDEATSALDSRSEQFILNSIEEDSIDKTVISIAHRLSTINDADNIIILKDGQLIEQGTHDELVQLDGEYAHFWRLQSVVKKDAVDK